MAEERDESQGDPEVPSGTDEPDRGKGEDRDVTVPQREDRGAIMEYVKEGDDDPDA